MKKDTVIDDQLVHELERMRLRLAELEEDTLERREREARLRAELETYRRLADDVDVGILAIDEHGRISYVNRKFREFTGYGTDEMIGRSAGDFLDAKNGAVFGERMAKRKRGIRGSSEIAWTAKDGAPAPTLVTVEPFVDGRGSFSGSVVLAAEVIRRAGAEDGREELEQDYRKLRRWTDGVVTAITKIVETRDPYTAGHERRVEQLAVAIGEEMRLSREQLDGLRMAAVIHDVGKIYVPAEILSKPGKLSDIEFDVVRIHPTASYEILKVIEFPWPVAEIAYQHQERFNGSGYPRGLAGEDIRIEARILAVADAVEAMSFHRPYRPSAGVDHALEELVKGRGTLFDPEAVDACIKLFREREFVFNEKKKETAKI